jgi:serine protease Do
MSLGKTEMLAVTCCILVASAFAQDGATRVPAQRTSPGTARANGAVLHDFDLAVERVAERISPAVVQIWVTRYGPGKDTGDSESVIERQRGIGSGVIVDPAGYIVTNAHVVAGAQRIRVVLTPMNTALVPFKTSFLLRQRTFEARLIGAHWLTDLAVLKIEAKDLTYVPLPEKFMARLGQTVLAIGSPEGLEHTITLGIVSAVGRQPELDRPMVYIQTDAPINPGNSGGALVDRDGNVIGINTFIYSKSGGSEGLGFAIPEPTVRFVYEEIKQYGHVRQTVIGANAQTVTPILASALKLQQDWGVIISDVTPDGPSEKAGLKPQDIVIAVDSRNIDSLPRFVASLFLHRHDEPVTMDVLRGTDKVKLQIPAMEAHSGVESLVNLVDPQKGLMPQLGTFVLDLDKSLTDAMTHVRSPNGVVVAGRVDYPTAVDADLVAGDVIRAVKGNYIYNIGELRSKLENFRPGDPVVLQVERQGVFKYISFEME